MNPRLTGVVAALLFAIPFAPAAGIAAPRDPKDPAPRREAEPRDPQAAPLNNPDPAAAPAEELPASPLETAISFAKAIDRNDIKAARELSIGKAPDMELLTALCASAGATRDLHEAAITRYGKVAAETLWQPAFAEQVLYGREKVAPGADTATVTLGTLGAAADPGKPAAPKPQIGLVKEKGKWKVDLATLPHKSDPDALAHAKSHAHAAGSTAAELKAGQYLSVREAGAALEKKAEAAFEAEARLARLNAKAREKGGDASTVPINKPNPIQKNSPETKKGWIGKEKPPAAIRATATNESLGEKSREMERGIHVTPLATKDVRDAAWSADGLFTLILQEDGTLRKVGVPSLVEERRIDLAAKPGGLAVCRSAVCVAMPNENELWVLDPTSLEVKRRVTVRGIRRLAASAASTYVFASTSEDQLAVINTVNGDIKYASAATLTEQAQLLSGKTTRKEPAKPDSEDSAAVRIGFHLITASPDGMTLYCADHLRIHRLRVRGGTLSYEDSSPEIGSDARELVISGDGQYIALPIGAGNLEIPAFPRPPFATYVFRGADLQKPVLIIDAGPHPRTMAFDSKAHAIYAQNDEQQLIQFNSKGAKVLETTLLEKAAEPTSMMRMRPSGGEMLAIIGQRPVLVEFSPVPDSADPAPK